MADQLGVARQVVAHQVAARRGRLHRNLRETICWSISYIPLTQVIVTPGLKNSNAARDNFQISFCDFPDAPSVWIILSNNKAVIKRIDHLNIEILFTRAFYRKPVFISIPNRPVE